MKPPTPLLLFLLLPVLAPLIAVEPSATATLRASDEALCGPGITTVGDAWEQIGVERATLGDALHNQQFDQVPQRLAVLNSHLAFMRRRSVMVWGEDRRVLDAAVRQVAEATPRLNQLALSARHSELRGEVIWLSGMLDTIAARYPDEALLTSTNVLQQLPPATPSIHLVQDSGLHLVAGHDHELRIGLFTREGNPVLLDDLMETHGARLHALLLNRSFHDYQHLHPTPTDKPGEYVMRYRPTAAGNHRLWVELQPLRTGRPEFPETVLTVEGPASTPPDDPPSDRADVGGFTCQLAIPTGLRAGAISDAQITIIDQYGRPVERLEPLMGAFAHLVGVMDDWYTVVHLHPLGPMPTPTARGGPTIDLRIRPSRGGKMRLFMQFRVDGQEHTARFVMNAEQ